MNPLVRVRDGVASDWDFIRKPWRDTFLRGGYAVRGAARQHYADEMTRLFAAIVPSASVKVACDPKDPETQLGFACYAGTRLYFVYVLPEVREEGIVPSMLEGLAIKHYTFATIQGDRRIKPAKRGWLYTPCFTFGS